MNNKIKCKVVLNTTCGKTSVPVEITYEDKEIVTNPKSQISLIYGGVEYVGNGTDYLWADALADLERKLPKDVKIACCMTCRYGNMCPYGNEENVLFCTKDLTITSKEDMISLFNETNPFEERSVASFDYCDDFSFQCDYYYTYNDYLYWLHKNG